MSETPNPIDLFNGLRSAYFRYYNTPFRFRDDPLNEERQARLDLPGGVWQPPVIEARPRYASVPHALATTCANAQAADQLADFAGLGLFEGISSPYVHQEEALIEALRGKDVAAVPGTGSGKTETLFLPVLARLIAESASWESGAVSAPNWWTTSGGSFVPQRAGETGRDAAVRAFVLYPMNALAEDQLVRLRRALDSDEVHRWLDDYRSGHRFYFGRYTGNTPVLGPPSDQLAVEELRERMHRIARNYRAAIAKGRDYSFYVPRPSGAEMISRWDMLDAPPDILVTNYSMLHVLLMREREQQIFDRTKQWLADNSNERVTLIVDESHLYRGTAGTEVGYMFRLLAQRLGLSKDLDRFQVLTASASLEKGRDDQFLRDFFGKERTFAVVKGTYLPVPASPVVLDDFAHQLTMPIADAQASDALFEAAPVEDALLWAFHQGDSAHTTALSVEELSGRLFPRTEDAITLTETILRAASWRTCAGAASLRLRAHMFFRNVPGMWACVDPACSNIEEAHRYPGRPFGRLFSEPDVRCGCGARILELLYCQDCGDVYLGGFTSTDPVRFKGQTHSLLADVSDLARLPDQASLERRATNYIVYWPHQEPPQTGGQWGANQDLQFDYVPAHLNRFSGDIEVTGPQAATPQTGWLFDTNAIVRRDGTHLMDPDSLPAFPTQCASCGADWEFRHDGTRTISHSDPARYRSPIRMLRTGFEKINQVLIEELADALGEEDRNLILFSDSRQDAAKLSAGIGIRHYQDLIRALFVEEFQKLSPLDDATIEAARLFVTFQNRDEVHAGAYNALRGHGDIGQALVDLWISAAATPQEESGYRDILTGPPTLAALEDRIFMRLAQMGVNPGGPKPTLQMTRDTTQPWSTLFNWGDEAVALAGGRSLDQDDLLSRIRESLADEVVGALAGSAGRDIESLGLGWLTMKGDAAPADAGGDLGLARASLRLLILRKRFRGLRDGALVPPKWLKQFWEAYLGVPSGGDISPALDACRRHWGNAVVEFCVDRPNIVLRSASEEWVCTRCQRRHLNLGAALCTRCKAPLPTRGSAVTQILDDYYAWKAVTGSGLFRLNTAELTGQTDRDDAESRQMRFQGVFLDAQANPTTDGVDLLSVTTTLEAGVDIGALNAVVMANMPPTRFNYQQRVGRAGRRETNVAIALTVCRGRSHDEYYFERPGAIANDPTPPPYLAQDRPEILARVLRSEVLRQAFVGIGIQSGRAPSTSGNSHGDFGQVADWPTVRPTVKQWLDQNLSAVQAVYDCLLVGTNDISLPSAAQFVDDLLADIDVAVAAQHGPSTLSERLAYLGYLPMFGFPTQVRYMHLWKPNRSYPWPPPGSVDRDLAIAIAQFAPGGDTVRDGSVYKSIAIAAFMPNAPSRRPTAVPDPLGPSRQLDLCRDCGSLTEVPSAAPPLPPLATCPRCGADPGKYGRIEVREPLGFASARAKDFDGNFAWSSRGGKVRALADPLQVKAVSVGALEARAVHEQRAVINDNNARLFTFYRSRPGTRRAQGAFWDGYYHEDAVGQPDGVERAHVDPTPLNPVALGAFQTTDILFIGAPGLSVPSGQSRTNFVRRFQPTGVVDPWQGRRAAWYSLAFLIRTAAAVHLDVQPQEFSAELHTGRDSNGDPVVWAFLADTLENGAGFSRHLGSENEFPKFLRTLREILRSWGEPPHAGECSSSCYKCLRDYTNMAYHALLDWRLAGDLLETLAGAPLQVSPHYGADVLASWSAAYGGSAPTTTPNGSYAIVERPSGKKAAVVVRHPLEAYEDGPNSIVSVRVDATVVDAEMSNSVACTVAIDVVTLERAPREAMRLVDEAVDLVTPVSW